MANQSLSVTAGALDPLEKALYMILKDYRKTLDGQNVIVAVSGGIDSIVLLTLLHKLQGRIKYNLHVVHINHGVRAKDADGDEAFVKALAEKMKIDFTSEKFKISKASENNLREKRYEILFKVKKKEGASVIFTAHHRDDLLETRLMRLLQGTGMNGLKAMSMINDEGIMRPLLSFTRRDIENYAKKLNLKWRNDATNSDTTKFRNWIRRNWIARLRMDHPGYVDSLFASLERLVLSVPKNQSKVIGMDYKVFDRHWMTQLDSKDLDDVVYNFLRQNTTDRVTSRHVLEFKKRLGTSRKTFKFRLAGNDWICDKNHVTPDQIGPI